MVGMSTDYEILSNFPNLGVDISNIPNKFCPKISVYQSEDPMSISLTITKL